MGSLWTDKSAILRDLSFAQGRWVPGGIDSGVAGAKPPAHNIKEETEEEYFQRWTMLESGGAGDFSAGPDLFRIKKMLELMQEEEAPNEEILSGPIEITKLNATAPKFVPKNKSNTKENIKPILNKPRKIRNVAIASIMAIGNKLSEEPLKLFKPEDFIKPIIKEDEEMKERRKDSVDKVTNWLQSQDITTMFKKKSVSSFTEKQSLKDVERLPKSPPSEHSVKTLNGYTPTVWAEEYYRKAVDRSHMRDLVMDDVWGRAERIMKEIDAKNEELRKQKAAEELQAEMARQHEALEAVDTAGDAETADEADEPMENAEPEGIAKILLPGSRHELFPGACVVCATLTTSSPAENDLPTAGNDLSTAGKGLSPVGNDLYPAGNDLSPAENSLSPVGSDLSPDGNSLSPAGSGLSPVVNGLMPARNDLYPVGNVLSPAGSCFTPAENGLSPAWNSDSSSGI